MSKPHTLVILTPGWPKDEGDSTCLPAQQSFVRTLNKLHPDLLILILAFEYPFTDKPYRWHGNEVMPLNGWMKGKIRRLFLAICAWRILNKARRERNIMGLLGLWYTGLALVGSRFGRKYGIRNFTWILGQDARKGNRYISLMRPQAAELIAMSDVLAEEFHKNHGIRPACLVPNGIDPSLFSTTSVTRDIDVLGVGSLIPLKQYDLFIRIISDLSVRLPGIRCVICGKGPEESRLRAAIREQGLEDRVLLTGEQPHEEVLRMMQRTRVFLHPSSYEGFSGVCLEALYAGAQVISLRGAMSFPVSHWHIAEKWNDMADMTMRVLTDPNTDHEPVMVYSMEDCVRRMMQLFDHGEGGRTEAATS